ncbi:low molecular weight protein arginine phosphatase [Ralstonia pickettii]|nr:low molecular weight protein arginine phosphatase [Ralstonia pickettii]
MAEALLKERYPKAHVQSAGIFANTGSQASSNAIKALQEKNISINHHSQPITNELLDWADLVLTMTTNHKQLLVMEYPDQQEKYFTLKEYVADADQASWQQFIAARTAFEEKRQRFIQENQQKYKEKQLNQALQDYLQMDYEKLQEMESKVINYDISDPFGGTLSIYRETLEELDRNIQRLINKMGDL